MFGNTYSNCCKFLVDIDCRAKNNDEEENEKHRLIAVWIDMSDVPLVVNFSHTMNIHLSGDEWAIIFYS